jgi:hypothetical protein
MKELGVDLVCTITDRLSCSPFDILPDSNNLLSTNLFVQLGVSRVKISGSKSINF